MVVILNLIFLDVGLLIHISVMHCILSVQCKKKYEHAKLTFVIKCVFLKFFLLESSVDYC